MTAPSTNARAGFLIVLLAALFTYGLIRASRSASPPARFTPNTPACAPAPTGAKLLYDSLSRTPGVTVARNYFPLEYLEESHAAVFLLALDAGEFAAGPEPYVGEVERLANGGNRVVAALDWSPARLEAGALPENSTNVGTSNSASTPTNSNARLYFSRSARIGACWTATAPRSWPSNAVSRRAAWCCSPRAAISPTSPRQAGPPRAGLRRHRPQVPA